MAWPYDPHTAPDPELWLALSEADRVEAVAAHHRDTKHLHQRLPNPSVHAAAHVVAENQLAMEEPPEARVALLRLMNEGLNRHEAIHAVAAAASCEMLAVMRERRPFDPERYRAALQALEAKSYLGTARKQD